LFAHRSWTTIRRENDAGVSRFFGDWDASVFSAFMKEEERYKKLKNNYADGNSRNILTKFMFIKYYQNF